MTVRQFLNVVELKTKAVSVSSFLLGTLSALYAGSEFSPVRFIVLAIAVLAVDMGTTAFNTFFDYMRGTDSPDYTREADKVLVHEGVAPAAALVVSLSLYTIAAVTGIVLTIMTGPIVLAAGVVGMLVGFLYNAGPLPISRTPVGEVFAGGFLGPVLFLVSYYVQAGSIDRAAVFASIPSFLYIASILTVNNTCDIEGDRASGRKTLSILIGRRAGERLVYLQGAVAHLTVTVLAVAGILPLRSLFTIALSGAFAISEYLRMHHRGFSHDTKGLSMRSILRIFIVWSLLFALSLLGAVV